MKPVKNDIPQGLSIFSIFTSFYLVSLLDIFETPTMSRLQKVDFVPFYFLSHFYFIFYLVFIFSIFRTLGLGLKVICHSVTSVTSDSVIPTLIIELKRKK